MEYQKIINLLNNTPNQPSKFKIKNELMIHVECKAQIIKLNLELHC